MMNMNPNARTGRRLLATPLLALAALLTSLPAAAQDKLAPAAPDAPAPRNPALRRELLAMEKVDQDMRARMMSDPRTVPGKSSATRLWWHR